MMEFVDTAPPVEVEDARYAQLLGYPRDRTLEGRAAELAGEARAWYREHGRPWICARPAGSLDFADGSLRVGGVAFSGRRLRDSLSRAGAHDAILVAVSAGCELEAEAHRRWLEEKPDEYYFLETYGSAVAEHLTTLAGARLCEWADALEMAVLPHSSPGYGEWDIAEQPRLLDLLRQGAPLPGPLDILESGMLRPKKSQLAVFGITRHTERVRSVANLSPCERCTMAGCRFRRTPYRRPAALNPEARYLVNPKALQRWSRERLTLEAQPGGGLLARFRYEGTTCTNLGRPLAFDYEVMLGTRAEGYPIVAQKCAPAPGDTGHRQMCQYQRRGEELMAEIARETPLTGMPLDDVLEWRRASSPAGCYCEPQAREHKWGLVLETIHYALSQLEKHNPSR
jgi:hypothetical protein